MSKIIAALILSITLMSVALFPQTTKNTIANTVGHEKFSPMDW